MKRFAGLLLLLAAIGAVVYYAVSQRAPLLGSPTTGSAPTRPAGSVTVVRGLVGGEKAGLLGDPALATLLDQRHGLKVEGEKRGSIEMVSGDVRGNDFLWPSSDFARELFAQRSAGQPEARTETVCNSPLVFYSWDIVTDALIARHIVEKRGEVLYLSDAPGLVKMIAGGTKWSEIGLPQLFGRVTVYSTDPTRSNSGVMFAALLATLLNDGDVVDAKALDKVAPQVVSAFARMGHMEGSSGDLFRDFLNTGVGANPIIVGYENQMIEYGLEHPEQAQVLQQHVRVLYPVPTMWSAHPIIALTEGGRTLLQALKDPEVQKLAWERHGFRSGVGGMTTDARPGAAVSLPPRIEAVVPMPGLETMQRLLTALQGQSPPRT